MEIMGAITPAAGNRIHRPAGIVAVLLAATERDFIDRVAAEHVLGVEEAVRPVSPRIVQVLVVRVRRGRLRSPANPYYQNLYDPRADWSDCFFDAKHVLSSYAVYEIPFGRGKKYGNDTSRAVDAIAGGWAIAPIISIHSGFPLALYDFGTDSTGTNSRGLRPDCGPGAGKAFGRQTALSGGKYIGYQWFDPTPYTAPAAGTFGNCPAQGPVRGPGYGRRPLERAKGLYLYRRVKLQFRSDFLNAFNRVNLSTPATALGTNMGVVNTSQSPRVIQFALSSTTDAV